MVDAKTAPTGRCWRCGYDLRGTTEPRCPECGLGFDPADPRTMHMGRHPISRLGRRIVQPPGRWTIVLAVLATASLVAATGWPSTLSPRWIEYPYYYSEVFGGGPKTARFLAWEDWLFLASTFVWAVLLAYLPLRLGLRGILLLRHRIPRKHRTLARWRLAGLAGLLVITAIWQAFGWPNRLAAHFAAQQIALDPAVRAGMLSNTIGGVYVSLPKQCSEEDNRRIIYHAATRLWTARQRTAGLALLATASQPGGGYYRLVNRGTNQTAEFLRDRLDHEPDPKVRLTILRMLATVRDERDQPRFLALIGGPDVEASATALEAIAFLSDEGILDRKHVLASDPLIETYFLMRGRGYSTGPARPEPWVPDQRMFPEFHRRLCDLAIAGRSEEERRAATNLLRLWQPGHGKLRLAEWGVWTADGAQIRWSPSLAEEIPPFVHQTGDSTASMQGRLRQWSGMVWKPIVHLTASETMAVDLAVWINRGRPWFAYPAPDDYHLSTPYPSGSWPRSTQPGEGIRLLSELDPPGFKPLANPGLHPTWLLPLCDTPVSEPRDPEKIQAWGVRWQTLLVTPQLQPGMRLADVPADKKFAWWNRLREVPSSYVTSRGETERFLYYDGPTHACLPFRFWLKDGVLTLEHASRAGQRVVATPPAWPSRAAEEELALPLEKCERSALYIEVAGDVSRAAEVTVPKQNGAVTIPALRGDALGQLRAMLVRQGLTPEEAGGLVDAWDPQFFHAAGKRLLLVLSQEDYVQLCPLQVTPNPTTTVRVGLVLYEFGLGG